MKSRQKFSASFKNAAKGIRYVFNHRNFSIMFAIACVISIFGALLNLSSGEWTVILLCIFFTLSLELLNTSIETILDHIHPEMHPKIGMAKDIAAGAVLFAAAGSAISGGIIFIPKIIENLN